MNRILTVEDFERSGGIRRFGPGDQLVVHNLLAGRIARFMLRQVIVANGTFSATFNRWWDNIIDGRVNCLWQAQTGWENTAEHFRLEEYWVVEDGPKHLIFRDNGRQLSLHAQGSAGFIPVNVLDCPRCRGSRVNCPPHSLALQPLSRAS